MPTGTAIPFERSGSGPSALLLHGGPGLSDYLGDLAALLGDRVEAIRYTQRGVAPAPLDGPFTIDRHVADAVAVLDAAGVDRAVVIGHSWGGHLAAWLAAARPDRVAAVISIDGLGMVGDGGWGAFDAHFQESMRDDELAASAALDARAQAGEVDPDDAGLEALALIWRYYFADPKNAPPMPPLRLRGAAYGECELDIKARLVSGEAAQAITGLAMPALFMRGSESGFPRAAVEDTACRFRVGRYVEIASAGHLPWIEQPAATLAVIEAFLDECRSAGALPAAAV